jgi:hypothetical protein
MTLTTSVFATVVSLARNMTNSSTSLCRLVFSESCGGKSSSVIYFVFIFRLCLLRGNKLVLFPQHVLHSTREKIERVSGSPLRLKRQSHEIFQLFFMNPPILGHELLHFVISKFMKIAEIYATSGFYGSSNGRRVVKKDNFKVGA